MSSTAVSGAVTPRDEVLQALERVLRSRHFSHTPRLSAFLRLVVEKTLRNEAGQIKEFVIAAEVYERGDDYDPRTDSIVRVEAGRLRARLRAYYETDGVHDALRIELPKGSYVPVFANVAAEPDGAAAAPPRRVSRRAAIGIAGAAAAACGALVAVRAGLGRRPAAAFLVSGERAARGGWSAESDDLLARIERQLQPVAGMRVLRSRTLEQASAQMGTQRDAACFVLVLAGRDWTGGPRLRAAVELRRADTGEPVWSRSFEDAVELAEALAGAVAGEAKAALRGFTAGAGAEESAAAKRATALHGQAQRILHHGKDFLLQTGNETDARWPLDELMAAARLLERARVEDPRHTAAHSSLAWVYRLAGEYDERMFPRSRDTAALALKLDPGSSEANFVRGYAAFFDEWDFVTAERCFRTDLERSVLHLDTYRYYIDAALLAGQAERAAAMLGAALSVLPHAFQLRFAATALAGHRGDYAEMERIARGTLAARADLLPARCQLAMALARQGKFAEGETLLRKVLDDHPGDSRAGANLARLCSLQGRTGEAFRTSAQFDLERRCPALVAELHARAGAMDRAFQLLRKAVEQHDHNLPYLVLDPVFRQLREHRQSAELFRSLRLSA